MDKNTVTIIAVIVMVAAVAIAAAVLLMPKDNSGHDVDKEKVVSGDTVSVNYVGTFYDYNGGENAAVFDTSYQYIAEDATVFKSNDYTPRSEYNTLDFKVGDGTVLKKFNDAVIGHSVGETVKVYLTAEEGYVAALETGTVTQEGNVMSSGYLTTSSYFAYVYPGVSLIAGTPVSYTTSYGWPGTATLSEDGTLVTMQYLPTEGKSYKVYDNTRTTVYYKVTDVGETITYDIDIRNPVYLDETSIQMIKLEMGSRFVYITDIDDDGLHYKTGGREVSNEPLYFQIEIVSINGK